MFENEGSEVESTQSDVVEESSSDSQSDSQATQQAAAPQEKEVPFHEHPRWKEVMEQRNASEQRAQALEQRLAEMDRRFQESQRPRSNQPDFKEVSAKMQERLKGIDPEFQAYMSLLEQQATTAQEQMAQYREEQLVSSLKSKFEDLASKSALDPTDKELYFSRLDQAYRQGKLRSTADVEAQFKSIHEPQAKRMEALKRAAIEEYTKAKKADASKPTAQPKGKAPVQSQDNSKMTQQEAIQARNKYIVKQLRAGRETN